jgi:succinate-semialdehyde dehydrogenase/glutarate-semialdehyde dehydrogenase
MVPQCGIAMEELFKEAQAQKDYTPIYWFGKKKYRFSEWWKNQRSFIDSSAGSSMAEAAGKYLKNQYLN